MEKKEKIQMAATLLRESNAFVGKEDDSCPGLSFDFVIDDSGEEMDIFRTDVNHDTFHWPEVVVEIANALGLSCYVHTKGITFGADRYGNDVVKRVICMHVL